MVRSNFIHIAVFLTVIWKPRCLCEDSIDISFSDQGLKICDGGLQVDEKNGFKIYVSICSGSHSGKIGIVSLKIPPLDFPQAYVDERVKSAEFLSQHMAQGYLYFVNRRSCVMYVNRETATINNAIGDCSNPIYVDGTNISSITGLGILGKFLVISSQQGLFLFDAETNQFSKRITTASSKVVFFTGSSLAVISESSTGDTEFGIIMIGAASPVYQTIAIKNETYDPDNWFGVPVDGKIDVLMLTNGTHVFPWNINCLEEKRDPFDVPAPPSAFVYLGKYNQTVVAYYNPTINSTSFKGISFSDESFTCPTAPTTGTGGLSGGAIAGIVIGVLIFLVIVVIVIITIFKRIK